MVLIVSVVRMAEIGPYAGAIGPTVGAQFPEATLGYNSTVIRSKVRAVACQSRLLNIVRYIPPLHSQLRWRGQRLKKLHCPRVYSISHLARRGNGKGG